MGNHPSRVENYAYPPHNYRPDLRPNDRPDRRRSGRDRRKESADYEPHEVPYQYPQVYQPYVPQPYMYSGAPAHGYALPYAQPPSMAYPAQGPVIPNIPPPSIPRAGPAPVYNAYQPASGRTYGNASAPMQMPEPATMPVPEPAPPPSARVIPPIPPPPVVPPQVPGSAPMMPPVLPTLQPGGSSVIPSFPVMPHAQTPGPRVLADQFSSDSDEESPVIPPLPPGFVPQGPVTPAFPAAPVIPPQPHIPNTPHTPRTPRIPRMSRTPGPGAARHRWSHAFPRLPSLHFRQNPLPQPPRTLPSPYLRLIDRLREDPGEYLRRKAAERGGASTVFVLPTTVVPSGVISANGDTYTSHHEKKQKDGIFRSFSKVFGRKSKKRKDDDSRRPAAQQIFAPASPALTYATAPPPPVIPASAPQPNVGPAGFTPGLGFAPPVRMPTPNIQASPRAASPRLGSPRAPSPRMPSPRPTSPRIASPTPVLPRSASPARSHRSRSTHPRIFVSLENEFGGLVHYSPHPVDYKGMRFPSAFHLLEALRFIESHPEIAEEISRCTSVPEVRNIVQQAINFVPPDWEHIVVSKMVEVLYEKFKQHRDLLELLFSTGKAELVFNDKFDDYWGVGEHGDGANELGKALMRLRDMLRADAPPR